MIKVMMDLMNDEQLSKMRIDAFTKYNENQNKKMKVKEIKEQTFLHNLKDSSEQFINLLIQKVMKELQYCSENGLLSKRFYVDHFKNKNGIVKVSTLVKGFRWKDGWNDNVFKQIGYSSTPFQYVVEFLKSKQILLEDISDVTKGLSFWCQVSFIKEESS